MHVRALEYFGAHFPGHADMRDLVLRHINSLCSATRNIVPPPILIVAVESNLGLEASHIHNLLKDNPRCVVLRETGPDGKHGVLTTHERKLEFAAVLEELFLQDAVSFASRIISDDADTCLKTLKKQLESYRMLSSELGRSNVFGAPKVTYSGKVGADGKMVPGALQDDLCIAMQMAAFWSAYVLQRKCKFLDYASVFA